MNPLSDLERLVVAIEKQGANIAPTYQEYMPIAFAIANDCGEAGHHSIVSADCRRDMSPPRRISYTTMPSKEATDGMAWDPYSTWRT